MSQGLPIIESCDSCGACCEFTPVPPFQPGEEAVKDVPDALLNSVRQRIAADQHFDRLPCVWYDSTARRCRHYDLRPDACRTFEIGSDLCRLSRFDLGIE